MRPARASRRSAPGSSADFDAVLVGPAGVVLVPSCSRLPPRGEPSAPSTAWRSSDSRRRVLGRPRALVVERHRLREVCTGPGATLASLDAGRVVADGRAIEGPRQGSATSLDRYASDTRAQPRDTVATRTGTGPVAPSTPTRRRSS
jgi:hypothetical protein